MSVLPLVPASDPVLRARAAAIARVDDAVRGLIRDLIDTMHAQEGIGIAAPQVGRPVQVVVVNPSQARGRERAVINPVVEAVRGRAALVEGCLSVPGVWERVARAAWVRVRGLDEQGQPVSLEAEGLLAAVLEHECDHLQGRLLFERVPRLRRWFLRLRRAGRPARRGQAGPPSAAWRRAGACA
jgi:peptide deformylase